MLPTKQRPSGPPFRYWRLCRQSKQQETPSRSQLEGPKRKQNHENLFAEACGRGEEVGADRRRGSRRRPSRLDRRQAPARQAQADLHPACRHGRQRHRHQCRQGRSPARSSTDKIYYWHTGYPGGIKERTARQLLEGRFPERVVEKAVERMIPRGPLGRRQLKNLRVYAGAETSARRPAARDARRRRAELQEREGHVIWPT